MAPINQWQGSKGQHHLSGRSHAGTRKTTAHVGTHPPSVVRDDSLGNTYHDDYSADHQIYHQYYLLIDSGCLVRPSNDPFLLHNSSEEAPYQGSQRCRGFHRGIQRFSLVNRPTAFLNLSVFITSQLVPNNIRTKRITVIIFHLLTF